MRHVRFTILEISVDSPPDQQPPRALSSPHSVFPSLRVWYGEPRALDRFRVDRPRRRQRGWEARVIEWGSRSQPLLPGAALARLATLTRFRPLARLARLARRRGITVTYGRIEEQSGSEPPIL